MLFKLGRDEKYVPGYWKSFPEAYVRDAMVYERLLEQSHPKVAEHLRKAGVVPEAYASKWCVCVCRCVFVRVIWESMPANGAGRVAF